MKQLYVFIRKEFFHVFRDRRTLLIMFGLPVIQIILFGYALTSEVKNAGITIADFARDSHSQAIIEKIQAGDYFKTEHYTSDYNSIERDFKSGKIKCAIIFPAGFGNSIVPGGKARIQIIADASDPNTAKAITNYLSMIINAYTQQISNAPPQAYNVVPELRMVYNEDGNGSLNFIPGVIALIFMIVCTTLTSVSVVREKETGTMEILLVSPFKPIMVLVAKAVPYLVLSVLNLGLILCLSVFVLDVPVKGSLLLLLAESALFIITCLSLGLLISNVTNTQQTAMLMSMLGMMLPTLILTGFLFPLENMPLPFRVISHIIPSLWYYIIVKAIMLKGLGISYIWKETLILAGMTVLLLTIALKNFKTRLQ